MPGLDSDMPELTPQQWGLVSWMLLRGRLRSYNDWISEGNLQSEADTEKAKEDCIVYMSGLLTSLSLGNIDEPESLFVEPAHLFSEEEVKIFFSEFVPDISPEDLVKMGISIINSSLVKRYSGPEAMMVGGFSNISTLDKLANDINGKSISLFDPLYGMGLLKKGTWKSINVANNLWLSRAAKLPEHMRAQHLKSTMDSLCEGVILAATFFSPILPVSAVVQLKKYEVPELVVRSQSQLADLLNAMSNQLSMSRTGYQLWFRGQPTDYLVPDRNILVDKKIAGYCSVRDSSLIPSLYRHIDKYQRDTDEYIKLIRHIGDWANSAKLLMPAMLTILDEEGKKPYVPKQVSANTQSRVTFYMAGRPHLDIPGLQDLGPYNLWEIIDDNGNIIDRYIKLHHMSLQSHNATLLLQHYGCPTSWLDITKDIGIGLWFALNRMETVATGKFCAKRFEWHSSNPADWPTLYIFALHPEKQPFIDTSLILAGSKFLRPQTQKCGLLGGAGNLCRNYAARFIAAKIRLGPEFQSYQTLPANKLFPDERDEGLKELLKDQDNPFNDKLFSVYEVIA